jgi:putative membrane protein
VRADLAGEEGWQRLHPLSPITRVGRVVPIVALSIVLTVVHGGGHDSGQQYYLIVVAVATVFFGVVNWLVTRWKIDGDTLRIESGLIRRDSKRLPLARIQAVDVVRPLLARLLGVSELRIRLAGSTSSDGRLAYLSESTALELRARLLRTPVQADVAMPGTQGSPPTAEHPIASVATGRLLGSVLLSGLTLILLIIGVVLLVLALTAPKAAAAAAGFLAIYIFSFASALWRRLSNGFHFEAVEAPEGIRVRRGLLQTVSETVPYGRIQAVRKIEPLLWRPRGWCRLEVDIAGAARKQQRGEGSGLARKALLPVGDEREAWHLVDRLMGGGTPTMTPPPRRARTKAPLSYHFLAAGHDDRHAVCVTGRLRKVTVWIPLEKSQSIRRVQGPVQRRLNLATVHVDAAGKEARAEFRDRSVEEADRLIADLSRLSRAAREHRPQPPIERSPDLAAAIPSGWYDDPSGRHQHRYWSEGAWTGRVIDRGVTAIDPIENAGANVDTDTGPRA